MIKLIVTDMDGTLLDSCQRLPELFFEKIETLYDRGVLFAAASGRQYYNLREIFKPIKDKMFFIAENGSVVFEGDHYISSSKIASDRIGTYVEHARALEGVYPVLSGVHGSYTDSKDPFFLENVAMYYERFEIVDDILKIEDPTVKIALFDAKSAERNSFPVMKQFSDEITVTISGENWIDLTNRDTNKGQGVKWIQKGNRISYDETMLFGDFLNDYEMMKTGKYSYAMANAHPKLKEICRYETVSNDENGVLQAIEKYFTF